MLLQSCLMIRILKETFFFFLSPIWQMILEFMKTTFTGAVLKGKNLTWQRSKILVTKYQAA